MKNGEYGLLIDYEYCSGCHACETACKMEHDLSEESFTALCDLARERGLTID